MLTKRLGEVKRDYLFGVRKKSFVVRQSSISLIRSVLFPSSSTCASKFSGSVSFKHVRSEIQKGEPILLLFGTGWGLEKNILNEADYVLDPIEGFGEYNHLPVRAAVAIILDRLISR